MLNKIAMDVSIGFWTLLASAVIVQTILGKVLGW